MADRGLTRCRILIVEDEYLLAEDLRLALAGRGAVVLGPVPSVSAALALLDAPPALDGAILDLNLGGEPAYPVADVLIGRGVPLIFTTGYDAAMLPKRFAQVPRCGKPVNVGAIAKALGEAIRAGSACSR